jgi:nucleotide-binding universal stress UspA family protein
MARRAQVCRERREVGELADTRTLIVAVEDSGTATVVAAEAAHVALATGTMNLVLVHVLDPHAIPNAAVALSGYYVPIAETAQEGEALTALAEQVIRAECAALGKPAPAMTHVVVGGNPAPVIAHLVSEYNADGIVLGARRPHAFGRLTHPDVRSHVSGHTRVRIHIASLQAPEEEKHG